MKLESEAQPPRIGVTGATGFVGRALVAALAADPRYRCVAATRTAATEPLENVEWVVLPRTDRPTDWQRLVERCDIVIHAAGLAHVDENDPDAIAGLRRANVDSTERLATQAAGAGVRRIVYLSSIKVNGDATDVAPFTAEAEPAPSGAYGQSKWHAEQALRRVAAGGEPEVAVVRPPLIYGPGVKANFARLLRAVDAAWPLPLQGIDNRRSLVAVGNLTDILLKCAVDPRAAGGTFLVSDGHDVSTAALMRRMALLMGRPSRLFHLPGTMLERIAALAGRRGEWQRLAGSLRVDIAETRRVLGWEPPISLEEGLRATIADYLEQRR